MSIEQSLNVDTAPNPPQPEEFGLLDIFVTLAENFKLLFFVPLLVGLLALALTFTLPKTFESVAILNADQAIASLMTTATVLDPVAAEMGLTKDESIEEARRWLREKIKVAVGRTDKLLTLTVSASSPQQAQSIAEAVLQKTYIQSRPKASELIRLQTQLKDTQVRIKNAEDAADTLLKRMDSNGASSGTESARGYAELLNVAAAAQTQRLTLEGRLEGLTEAQLVQNPTLPQKASKPKKALVGIGVTLATGIILLIFVFIRNDFRSTEVNAEAKEKIARIKRSFSMR